LVISFRPTKQAFFSGLLTWSLQLSYFFFFKFSGFFSASNPNQETKQDKDKKKKPESGGSIICFFTYLQILRIRFTLGHFPQYRGSMLAYSKNCMASCLFFSKEKEKRKPW